MIKMDEKKFLKRFNKIMPVRYLRDGFKPSFKGMNCLGLVSFLRPDFYALYKNIGGVKVGRHISKLDESSVFIELEKPIDYCIVTMNEKIDFVVKHVGIYYKGKVIHTTDRTGVIVQDLSSIRYMYQNIKFLEIRNKNGDKK